MGAFADVPPVVAAAIHDIDLFERGLSHVAEPESTGLAVETPTPGIAEADRIDLGTIQHACPAEIAERRPDERIVRRYCVGGAEGPRVNVDADRKSVV